MLTASPSVRSKNKPLKASFAGASGYHSHFKESTAQLTISVGQPIHEGEKLVATLKLINRSFSACKIMIDDSIQWYTLAILNPEASQENLIQQAIEAGDRYLHRHQDFFTTLLTIPYDIIRWKDWLNTPAWQNAVLGMQVIYQEDEIIREAIRQNVDSFLSRYEKRSLPENYVREHAENLCTHYLLEECAVMKDLWVTLGCHYEVYPSGRNEAMSAIYERYIKPHPEYFHLLKSIGIRFHRRGNVES